MKFIDYIKFLREKYEISNTELLEELSSSGCEITKGSLSHKLNGERKITHEELEIFITVLQPSVAEEHKLRELYKVYDFGEVEFEEVKLIKEYIEQFDNNTVVQIDAGEIDIESVTEINDDRLLSAVLYKLLSNSWGIEEVEIMCQPEFTKLIDALLNLGSKMPAKVKQLICFNNDYKNDSNIYNIKCLEVLNKLATHNPNYGIRYFYDKVNARANPLTVFPFYIISGGKALLLSYDYKSGYLIHDTALVKKYRMEFERVFELGHELFQMIDNDLEYMQLCSEFEKTANEKFYTLQYHPCIRFNGDERITSYCVKKDIPFSDTVLEFITSSWKNPHEVKGYHLHSSMGVQDFMENGITTDMATELFNPVAEADRAIILEKIKANKVQIDVEINDSFIRIPYALSIVCYDSGVVLISYREANGSRLILKERSLYKSVMNFFKYMCEYETKKHQS